MIINLSECFKAEYSIDPNITQMQAPEVGVGV